MIEASIRVANNNIPTSYALERISRLTKTATPESSKTLIELKNSDESKDVSISIGEASTEFRVLTSPRRSPIKSFTIAIRGLRITQHDQTVNYLVKISNAIFFEIELLYRQSFILARVRTSPRPLLGNIRRNEPTTIQFPRGEYHDAPMSLYWYAKSASGMSLLQFLAFYQVVEYYFPIYSEIEAQRRVQNILKSPTFSPFNTADISNLLAAIKSGTGRGYGTERTQLSATVQECLDPQALWTFLTDNEYRKESLSKGKLLPKYRISLGDRYADVRDQVANRIYELRCKVVHTKSDSGDTELELLLPFSKEAESMESDIELIEYVAQQVLIASSRPLQI